MRTSLKRFPAIVSRSFAFKNRRRNVVNTCAHVGRLHEFYTQLLVRHFDRMCACIPVASFPFAEAVTNATLGLDLDYDKLYVPVFKKLSQTSPEKNSLQIWDSPRDLCSLAECIFWLARNRTVDKRKLLGAYDLIVEKSSLFTPEESKQADKSIHDNLARETSFNYTKAVEFDKVETPIDLRRHTENLMVALRLPRSANVKFTFDDTDCDVATVSSTNECSVLIAEYENYNEPRLVNAMTLLERESPKILALDMRPDLSWQSPVLVEKTIQDYLDSFTKRRDEKSLNEKQRVVYENLEQMVKPSFYDTMIVQFLGLMRKKPPLTKARMSCLACGLPDQLELDYLNTHVTPQRAKELYDISKYYRLAEAMDWLDLVNDKLCPKCGEEIENPPEIWHHFFSDGDISGDYRRNYAAKQLVDLMREERKFTRSPIKALMFVTHEDFIGTVKAVYQALNDKSGEPLVLGTKEWAEVEASEEELEKAVRLSTAFMLKK